MTVAAIVQARLASTRLPGKVMLPLAGRSVLEHVLSRCKRIPGVDTVVCAIPDRMECLELEERARIAGAEVFRGSESDVLSRYAGAARLVGARFVIRVTSDCPLIDPLICSSVLTKLRDSRADFACNNDPPTWPHGLDCEAMTSNVLYQAEAEAVEPYDREHVTPWIRRCQRFKRINVPGPGTETHLRWTLDFPEDYTFMKAVFEAIGGEPETSDVLRLLAERADIAEINSRHSRAQPLADAGRRTEIRQ